MKYMLMHKEIPVCKVELDEATGGIRSIGEMQCPKHLPVGISVKKGRADRAALNEWWLERSIPASRSGIRQVLETLELASTRQLLTRCMGLSLSDQYWMKPENSDVSWQEVNFFQNEFSEDVGDVLLGKKEKKADFDFHSPDNTSDGCLKKRWKLIDGKRCLIKAGSSPFLQQPFNEVIATAFMERLGIPHVSYTLLWDGDVPYSVCEDFVTANTELVSAWRVMQTQKRENNTSVYRHYLNCCEALEVPGVVPALDQMIVLDYLIANEDRHQNNFGLLRNADTLEWIGAAPVFDSGSSLGYDKLAPQILAGKGIECKPFKKSHEEQLKLVTSFDWIVFEKLQDMDEVMRSVFETAGEYMDDIRKNAIIAAYRKRLEYLERFAGSRETTGGRTEDNVKNDVAADIARTY